MSLRGIDVSNWQGTINWPALKGQVDFVIMKATQGTSYIDADLAANRAGARGEAIPHAFYHYPNGGDPSAEATFFVNACQRVNGEGQSLDFEGDILHIGNPVGWALAWNNAVMAKTGNRPIDYMSGSVTTQFDWSPVVKANYALWVASWGAGSPAIGEWPFWAFWQTSDNGHVAGIGGNVDTDTFNGGAAQLAAYFANQGGAPTPAPPPPVPVPPPAPQPVAGYYTVTAGDTLSSIAARYGTSVGALEALNPGAGHPAGDFNNIWPGDRLRVAGAHPAPAPPSGYTVRSGDTMSSIATAHNLSLAALEAKNPQIHDPNLIFPGEHVNL